MEVIPLSRATLRQLKSVTDEQKRQENIDRLVKSFYKRIVEIAKTSTTTVYKFQLERPNGPEIHAQFANNPDYLAKVNEAYLRNMSQQSRDVIFILENKLAIIEQLETLFPDCNVAVKTMSKAADGQFYDASTLDESVLPFIDRRHDQTFLIVDWS